MDQNINVARKYAMQLPRWLHWNFNSTEQMDTCFIFLLCEFHCFPQSFMGFHQDGLLSGLFCKLTPWRNGSASDSRSEGCVFESRRGQLPFSFYKLVKQLLVGNRKYKTLACDSHSWRVERYLQHVMRLLLVNVNEASCCKLTPWRNGSASDSRSEGCVFESRRGQLVFSS